MAKQISAASYLEQAMQISGKSQKEISDEIGLNKPNMLSMMKKGVTRIPLYRVPALAKACGVDPAVFVRITMTEYMPEVWEVISANLGEVLSQEERDMLAKYRAERETADEDGAEETETA